MSKKKSSANQKDTVVRGMRRALRPLDCPFFCSIVDILKSGYDIGEIVTAVEAMGYFTWDSYGRFVHIPPTGGDDESISTRGQLLDELAESYRFHFDFRQYDPAEKVEHNKSVDYRPGKILFLSGWPSEKLPDFESLQENWDARNAGTEPPPRPPTGEMAPQSGVMKLLKGLVVLNYGEDILDDLRKGRSNRLTEVFNDLEQKGLDLSRRTIARYLKDLPD